MNVLRWLLVLPAAVGGSIVGRVIIVVINRVGMLYGGLEPSSFLWIVSDRYLSGIALGAAFVYCGAYIAPTRKRETAAVLFGITLFLLGGAFFPLLGARLYWSVWEIASIAMGGLLTTIAAWSGEILGDVE